jgi:tetratricopeptide (TPR) repeat protein
MWKMRRVTEIGHEDSAAVIMERKSRENILNRALEFLEDKDYESALDILEALVAANPADLQLHSYAHLVETVLLKQYLDAFKSMQSIPRINPQLLDKLTQLNLEGNEGYLLTQIDGNTNIRSLVYICGMKKFDTLRTLKKFQTEDIIVLS